MDLAEVERLVNKDHILAARLEQGLKFFVGLWRNRGTGHRRTSRTGSYQCPETRNLPKIRSRDETRKRGPKE
jgi:hypothetical protein